MRALGLAHVAVRDPTGLAALTESAAVLASSGALLERARVLHDLGAAHRRANRLPEARQALEEGLGLARRCGAVPLADALVDELAAAGRRRPRAEAELTRAEWRVAEHVAAGGPTATRHASCTYR